MTEPADRRAFLSLAAAGLAAGIAVPSVLPAQTPALEPWLAGLNGKHRQFFDVGSLADGRPLKRIGNFLVAYRTAYGIAYPQVNALFGAHGTGLGFILSDSLWQQFKLGALYGLKSATNPYLTGDDSVSDLMNRGVRFLGCMNTVATLSRQLAAAGHGSEAALRETITKGFIPGAMPVPAMLLAGNRAQESGFTYAFIA